MYICYIHINILCALYAYVHKIKLITIPPKQVIIQNFYPISLCMIKNNVLFSPLKTAPRLL